MTFVHGQTGSSKTPVARLATEQRLSKLEERLQKLENMTGLKEPSALDRLLGTDKPITEQLERHTRRLTELSEKLEDVSQQVKLVSSNTEVRNIRKQVAQLSEQVKRNNRWLMTSPITLFLDQHSHDCPAFLLDLDRLRKQVNDHQGVIDWVGKKFNLVKQGTA